MNPYIAQPQATTLVQADYFAIHHHSVPGKQFADSQRELMERGKRVPVPRD